MTKEPMNLEEMMDFLHDSKLRIVEYKLSRKENHINYNVLDVIINDIWQVLAELSSKSNLKFQRLTTLNETDQLDLVCSYLVGSSLYN